MADTRVSGLTADATPGLDSLLYTVNDPGGTPGPRQTTIAELMTTTGLVYKAETVTTGDITGVVGTFHYCTIAGMDADRNFVLPASAAVGDRIGVFIADGDASFGFILKAAAGDTLNGVTAAEWSRLFIAYECVIMRCVVANTTWIVEYDGRIPCRGILTETVATALAHGTNQLVTLDNAVYDLGNVTDASNNRFTIRRNNDALLVGRLPVSSIVDQTRIIAYVYKDAVLAGELFRNTLSYDSSITITGSGTYFHNAAVVAEYFQLYGYWSINAGSGTKNTAVGVAGSDPYLAYVEVLKR